MSFPFAVPPIGSLQLLHPPHVLSSGVNYSRIRGCSVVKPMNAQFKRNDSLVPFVANTLAPGNFEYLFFYFHQLYFISGNCVNNGDGSAEVAERTEIVDYDGLAKDLENASPLEIMDQALEKFGDDIAIAFRCVFIPLFD